MCGSYGRGYASQCEGRLLSPHDGTDGRRDWSSRRSYLPPWSTPLLPFASLIDYQRPSPERRSMEPGNRGGRRRGVRHIDKAKAPRPASVPIGVDDYVLDLPIG